MGLSWCGNIILLACKLKVFTSIQCDSNQIFYVGKTELEFNGSIDYSLGFILLA